uniref:uncharacterized protein LOC122597046 n=1 Tax=Erigeron canadensis TaxID=72917 RepID=UPI001CB98179|nr:uncharacterized protein LOC122597046 [Erigeron canadensis]
MDRPWRANVNYKRQDKEEKLVDQGNQRSRGGRRGRGNREGREIIEWVKHQNVYNQSSCLSLNTVPINARKSPDDLSLLSYYFELELVNGGLTKIDQVIRDCMLELWNHLPLIDLALFDIGSFDVIVRRDWMLAMNTEFTTYLINSKALSTFLGLICGRVTTKLRIHEDDILKTATVMPFGMSNAPAVIMDLMNRACRPYLHRFAILFIYDILVYPKTKEEHSKCLKGSFRAIPGRENGMPSSPCEFWLEEIHFLGPVVSKERIHVDPNIIEMVEK